MIVSVRAGGVVPEGAREWKCDGLTIYPGLIEAYLPVDAPAPDKGAPGRHWNEKVMPQRSALDGAGVDTRTRDALRKLGFTVAAIAPRGGVFRGTGAVVSLSDDPAMGESSRQALLDHAFDTVALESGGWGTRSYPGSQMGAIALIRQTLSDAQWRDADLAHFAKNASGRSRPAPASSLDALVRGMKEGRPLFFPVNNELEALRAHKLAREFDRRAIIAGAGGEVRRLDAIAATRTPVVAPVDFPEAPKISSHADLEATDLNTLLFWDQAPTNARRLHDAGVPFALTTDRLRNRGDFRKNLGVAIERGLSTDAALAALTVTPAEILGVAGKVGRVAPGYHANLVVVDGDLFDTKSTIRDVWVDGRRYEITPPRAESLDGEWAMTRDGDGLPLTLSDDGKKGKFVARRRSRREAVGTGARTSVARTASVSCRPRHPRASRQSTPEAPWSTARGGDAMPSHGGLPTPMTFARPSRARSPPRRRTPNRKRASRTTCFLRYPFGAYAVTELPRARRCLTSATI